VTDAPERRPATRPAGALDQIDVSTPEGQAAVRAATTMILEIREDVKGPLARKVELYERTLGLAVIPVLLRRLVLRVVAWRRRRSIGCQ